MTVSIQKTIMINAHNQVTVYGSDFQR